jgi:Kdo2-lipid IVA lauroyltransferase/acyltransferase
MFYVALILLKLIGWFFSFFPRKIFLFLGNGLGKVLYKGKFRSEVANSNLKIAFPYLSAEQRKLFLRDFYAEIGVLFLEMLASFFQFRRFVEKNCDVEGGDNLRNALKEGKGVFVMTAHLGNWEVLCATGPLFFQTPVTMVTKVLKPEWFHRVVVLTREMLGVKMACEPKTMQSILRALKKNEIVGFVMDQYTGAPVGARVPFFGVPVGSHTALATLALRTEAPVVPAIGVRKPDGRYLIRFEPAFHTLTDENQEVAVLKNTAQYVKHTEAWIKEFPLQWMWVHRRWKGDLSPLPTGAIGEMLK